MSGEDRRGVIVALHGVTDNGASLADLAAHWNGERRVYLLDTLGHGLSRHPTDDELEDPFHAAVEAARPVLLEAADASAEGKVVLVSHSMGGAMAAALASELPEYVSALVLEDPALLTGDGDDVLWGASGLREAEAAGNPHLSMVLLPGASHTVRRDRSADFYREVDRFLASAA